MLAGEVVEMYGRKIDAEAARRHADHTCIFQASTGACGMKRRSIASKEIILCEALIDALTFWVAGYRNVTASYGVNGFTADHRAAFERHGTERVYIAYDSDEAGNKAAAKLAEELMEMGIECFRVEFPKGMDANEYALKVTPATKSLGVLLNRAAWLGKGQRPAGRAAVPVIVAEPPTAAPPSSSHCQQKQKAQLKKKSSEESQCRNQSRRPCPTADVPAVDVPTEESFFLSRCCLCQPRPPPRGRVPAEQGRDARRRHPDDAGPARVPGAVAEKNHERGAVARESPRVGARMRAASSACTATRSI